jgi:hypothetical protein
MDDSVKAALRKWPNVPACHGWLGLDARGAWYMRDDAVQAAGPFARAKGDRIEHVQLRAFIERNYELDAQGRAYFQNGPQQVFVSLEVAPWILGVQRIGRDDVEVRTHTGRAWPLIDASWVDEHGRLFLASSEGLGLVRSTDMAAAADLVESGCWEPQATRFAELVERYCVCLDPRP